MFQVTDDVRIGGLKPLIPPAILMEELPLTEQASNTIVDARRIAGDIVKGRDDRIMVVVGPCSIHDTDAALEYATKLQSLAEKLRDELFVIMRVYFEKPRTTVGWKGLINDPNLDGSFAINNGLRMARGLLLELAKRGLPAGSEFLDVITPQFIADLISWGAIGARTTESQIHRELASGLSMPVGFKNGTDGNVQIAIDAIRASRHAHHFLSVTKQGISAIVNTTGNDTCHLILRGSNVGPNCDRESIIDAQANLAAAAVNDRIMVDCSHGNSRKDHTQQPLVAAQLAQQIAEGSTSVMGVMLESHLKAGKQDHQNGVPLVYGQSITDACLDWESTVPVLEQLAAAVRTRRQR
ncbi:MAG: 3-deoxy-7-phosphoheptulonate synthase [Proteobacteria bacterium]|nr:3-deoxy-7-phosphoheptulonate synthase [Pseudomonadota bacterium]